MPPSVQRLLLSLLPAVLLVALASVTVWGESGVLARERLRSQLQAAQAEHAAVERENQRLIRDLRRMERDPVIRERISADEIGYAEAGSTIIRFE